MTGALLALVLGACTSAGSQADDQAGRPAESNSTNPSAPQSAADTTPPPREAAARQILTSMPCEDAPDARAECFELSVRANRGSTDQPRFMTLPVMVLRAVQPTGDPVVVLAAGPGRATLPEAAPWALHPLRDAHDIVLYDQRGTGRSTPSFDCPEFDQELHRSLRTNDPENEAAAQAEALLVCQARLAQDGLDTADINAVAIAADLDDLRVQLGHPSWILYAPGEAQTVARAAAAAGQPIIGIVVDERATAPAPAELEAVQAQYDAAPWVGAVDTGDGDATPFVVNGSDIAAGVAITMTRPELRPSVPVALTNLQNGITDVLPFYVQLILADSAATAEAAELSVRCGDDPSSDKRCTEWGVPAFSTPRPTATPTLTVTGGCTNETIVRWLDDPLTTTC